MANEAIGFSDKIQRQLFPETPSDPPSVGLGANYLL